MKENYIEAREAITNLLLLLDNKAFRNLDVDMLTVLKALNKQIPNAPIKVEAQRTGSSYSYYNTEYDCPFCRKVKIKKGQKYCDNCGQALKWESEATDNDN